MAINSTAKLLLQKIAVNLVKENFLYKNSPSFKIPMTMVLVLIIIITIPTIIKHTITKTTIHIPTHSIQISKIKIIINLAMPLPKNKYKLFKTSHSQILTLVLNKIVKASTLQTQLWINKLNN